MAEIIKTLEGSEENSKMLSLVSHKLKTPLSIINGYSEAILSQSSKENFSPFTAKALEEIHKQGTKLCYLVDKLLFFNKINNLTQKDLALKTISLKKLLKSCANEAISREDETSIRPTTAEGTKRGTFIEIDCPASLELKADAALIPNKERKANESPDHQRQPARGRQHLPRPAKRDRRF